MIKPDCDDPDLAIVVETNRGEERDVSVAFVPQLDEAVGSDTGLAPDELSAICEEHDVSMYSYPSAALEFEEQH